MSEPFLGEIRIFGFTFAPNGWALCNGQILSISQNTALFALLGTTYGGDGVRTFALPNLQGRVPLCPGQGPGLSPYNAGDLGGAESVTLDTNHIAAHTHLVSANSAKANKSDPIDNFPATDAAGVTAEYSATASGTMNPTMIHPAGGGQPHENRQPYLAVNFCIALQGIFPSRS